MTATRGGGHSAAETGPAPFKASCPKCGARRVDSQLGLEESPAEFVEKLVAVFREVRRVLVPWGVCWVNMGDSFHAGKTEISQCRASSGFHPKQSTNCESGAIHRKTVSGYKPLDLLGVPWLLVEALRRDGWYWRDTVAWTKCLSGGAYVYARTQKGDMPTTIKDLVRLRPETVKLWNGQKWTQVKAFMKADAAPGGLEIELRSGERIGCTAEHRWPTNRGVVRADKLKIGDVIQTCTLPEPEAPQSPGQLGDAEIGWLVGMYIAEGNRADHDKVVFSLHQDEFQVVDRLKYLASGFDGSVSVSNHRGHGMTVSLQSPVLQAILKMYVSGSTSKDKHLTTKAWRRSNAFLRALVEGYLEGDGGYDKTTRRWNIGFTSNRSWATDLRCLCARLQYTLRLKRTRHRCGGKLYPGWRGKLRLVNPEHHATKDVGEVIAIRASRARCYWDIAVEDEPHHFALASGVLTHNSAPMPQSITGWRWERCRRKVAAKDTTHMRDGRGPNGAAMRPHSNGTMLTETKWRDCPGCRRCAPHGGYVLRKGAWRHTSAWEPVFMLTPSAIYFCDQDAARTPPAAATLSRDKYSRITATAAEEQYAARHDHETTCDPAGANPRNVLHLGPNPASFGLCRACGAYHRNVNVLRKRGKKPLCACGAQDFVSHYAAYSPALVEPLLRASTSAEGCCPTCLMPWVRVAERQPMVTQAGPRQDGHKASGNGTAHSRTALSGTMLAPGKSQTIGWRPSCGCAAGPALPMTILDPFVGTGTTLLVARRLGLRAVGLDLSADYAALARARVLDECPLFGG